MRGKNCRRNCMCLKCQKYWENEKRVYDLVKDMPFVHAVVDIHMSKRYPKYFPCNKKLLTPKYEVKLKTFALNELLGRPVPNVIHLGAEIGLATYGNFEKLDSTLGIDSNISDENELKKQSKINDIMANVLKARGVDFDEIIAVTTETVFDGLEYLDKMESIEKTTKVRKMKLKNQRKLENIEPSQSNGNEKSPEKVSNNSGKRKTAKDFEHYRKTKKPNRI